MSGHQAHLGFEGHLLLVELLILRIDSLDRAFQGFNLLHEAVDTSYRRYFGLP